MNYRGAISNSGKRHTKLYKYIKESMDNEITDN